MDEDRSAWASTDPKRLAALVGELQRRDEQGCSDQEIAVWLKAQTASFGDGRTVLSTARGIPALEAIDVLDATSVWRSAATRYRLVTATGFAGEYRSANGHLYGVGDVLLLPRTARLLHPGPRNAWRVVAAAPDDDPGFTARLTIERSD